MGRAYSQDLRERVIASVDSGTGAYAAAFVFRVTRTAEENRRDERASLGRRLQAEACRI
jgi:Transposase